MNKLVYIPLVLRKIRSDFIYNLYCLQQQTHMFIVSFDRGILENILRKKNINDTQKNNC